jgi:predicted transglutaminase-like cysteine proteinase
MVWAEVPSAADCPALVARLRRHLRHSGVSAYALNFLAAIAVAVVAHDALYVYEHDTNYAVV